jgi:CO/xanthine dehydrogenase Mo-binding subunit
VPTILDMPLMRIEVLEDADPHANSGVRGVGEPPRSRPDASVGAAPRRWCSERIR